MESKIKEKRSFIKIDVPKEELDKLGEKDPDMDNESISDILNTWNLEGKLQTEEVTVGEKITCDVCKKVIKLIEKWEVKESHPYYVCTTGHYEWGYDSIESIKTKHICSDECLAAVMCDYMDDVKNSNSQYLKIEHENS